MANPSLGMHRFQAAYQKISVNVIGLNGPHERKSILTRLALLDFL